MTTQPAPDFDAAREAYETAQAELRRVIDHPAKDVTAAEYADMLRQAFDNQQRAHETMMEAWG